MNQSEKFLNLESLRGVAALSVALFHFGVGSHFHSTFTDNAWLMVDFFFVLSGFVIALNYQGKISSFKNVYGFQFKRFLRIYPLHIVMLLVYLGIEVAKYVTEVTFNIHGVNPAFSKNNLPSFISNVFLLQNFTETSPTWDFPSWSISAEFYTYLIFGLAVWLTRGKQVYLLILSLVFIGISLAILSEHRMLINNISGPSRCGYAFFLGVIIFNIYRYCKTRIRFSNSLVAIVALAISICAILVQKGPTEPSTMIIPLIFSITILALVLTNQQTVINRFLSTRALVYLGAISYGVYMIHAPVWWVLTQLARIAFKIPVAINPDGTTRLVLTNIFVADVVVVLGSTTIILLAHVSYTFIEMKFNRYRSGLRAS